MYTHANYLRLSISLHAIATVQLQHIIHIIIQCSYRNPDSSGLVPLCLALPWYTRTGELSLEAWDPSREDGSETLESQSLPRGLGRGCLSCRQRNSGQAAPACCCSHGNRGKARGNASPASFEDELLQQHPRLPHLLPSEAAAGNFPRTHLLERDHQFLPHPRQQSGQEQATHPNAKAEPQSSERVKQFPANSAAYAFPQFGAGEVPAETPNYPRLSVKEAGLYLQSLDLDKSGPFLSSVCVSPEDATVSLD